MKYYYSIKAKYSTVFVIVLSCTVCVVYCEGGVLKKKQPE